MHLSSEILKFDSENALRVNSGFIHNLESNEQEFIILIFDIVGNRSFLGHGTQTFDNTPMIKCKLTFI